MRDRGAVPWLLLCTLALAACSNRNLSTGNDTEAALDAAAAPSPTVPAARALAGVESDAIQPETMSVTDVASIGGDSGRCVFRLTRAAFPSLVYGDKGATIKLNGKLIALRAFGTGHYADAGLDVTVVALDADASSNAPHDARMVVRPPGTTDERGYVGYTACNRRPAGPAPPH